MADIDGLFRGLAAGRDRLPVADGNVIRSGSHEYDPNMGEVYLNSQDGVEETAKLWAGAQFMFRTLAVIEAAARNPGANPAETLARIADAAKAARPVPTIGEAGEANAIGGRRCPACEGTGQTYMAMSGETRGPRADAKRIRKVEAMGKVACALCGGSGRHPNG